MVRPLASVLMLGLAACTLDRAGLGSAAGAVDAGVDAHQGGSGPGGASATGGSGGSGGAGGASKPGVGDCVLGGAETCDDCNTKSGDGCSAQGQTEPGWLCPDVAQPCEHVSGVSTTPGSPTAEIGDANATPAFVEACPAGKLLVGIAATDSGDWPGGDEFLSFVAPRCAAPQVDATGSFVWSQAEAGAQHGGVGDCCVTNVTPYAPIDCPADGFVMGFRARATAYVTTLTLECGPLVFDGQGLVVGAPSTQVGPVGSGVGNESGDALCPAGTVAAAIVGSAGAVLDRIGLRCDTPTFTICGDGTLNGAEQCDDANAVGGDGCSDVCATE